MAHELSLTAISSSQKPPVLDADAVNPSDGEGNQGSERSSPCLSYTLGSWWNWDLKSDSKAKHACPEDEAPSGLQGLWCSGCCFLEQEKLLGGAWPLHSQNCWG